jgi:CheY-like chemotaxis protein
VEYQFGTSDKVIVWVIDDGPSNHRLVERSLPDNDGSYELVSYMAGEDAVNELEIFLSEAKGRDHIPDVVFMDYYLGETNGGQVTAQIRRLFEEYRYQGPYIIGHSSMFSCSQVIMTLGGDIAIHKNSRKDKSRDIVGIFPDLPSLRMHAGRGRQRLPS